MTVGYGFTGGIGGVSDTAGEPSTGGLHAINAVALSTTPGSVRAFVGSLTLAATTTSGTLAAIRGVVTAVTAITGSVFVYGVQGKCVLDGVTVAAGSAHVCAVLAQLSGSGMTATSGHIAALVVSGQSLPASANVNLAYFESGGATINAAIQFNCRSTYLFDINNFESCGIVAAAGSGGTGSAGYAGGAGIPTRVLKVLVDAAVAYIPLYSTNA